MLKLQTIKKTVANALQGLAPQNVGVTKCRWIVVILVNHLPAVHNDCGYYKYVPTMQSLWN